MAIFNGLFARTKKYSNKPSYDDLINIESNLGRTLFGPVPAGHQREFFASKPGVWIWYDKWEDITGVMHEMTIRYEVRSNGVFKKTPDGSFSQIKGAELDNFVNAARRYFDLVKTQLYG